MAESIGSEKSDVENILGQFYFATGCGAGGQWVQRDAIQVIRDRFLDNIRNHRRSWSNDAPRILHYMATIGRQASIRSVGEGRHKINAQDMEHAIKDVIQHTKREGDTSFGVWCE